MTNVQPGQALGASYRFVQPIGSGAVGEVWRISALAGGMDLAAKVLRSEHAQDAELVERFVRERSVLVGLRHPSIVAVRDLVVEGELLAIVMDLVPGGSVRDLLRQRGTLPAAQALLLCAQVLDALAAAHAAHTTHRDIKPDNVLLAESWDPAVSGTVRVTDFGIASVVQQQARRTTGILGTPGYMPPELLTRGETGPAGDVYATGIMLYELLAGRTPFAGPGTDFTVSYRHVNAVPPRLDVPQPLWAVLQDLLEKNPAARPGAAEAAARLRSLAADHAALPALPVAEDPSQFEDLARPVTMLRSVPPADATPDGSAAAAAVLTTAPDLGAADHHTIIRPALRPQQPVQATTEPQDTSRRSRPAWLSGKVLGLAAAAVALVAALVAGIIALSGPAAEETASAQDATASQQDTVLPSGLTVSRQASYDAQAQQVRLSVTYAAQKSPLSGEFLQVLPAPAGTSGCPAAAWTQVQAARNQQSLTGVAAPCGWELTELSIPAQSSVEVQATFGAQLEDQQALQGWLDEAGAATQAALSDRAVEGAAYPAQRLQDIEVQTPARTVSQTPLPVTLVPVWPSGPDVMDPLYASPATGKPSATLKAIAGGEDGVRFSDACSGALAVSGDGLVVTALTVSPSCTLRASVGNFTDLASQTFSITTRQ